MSKSIPPVVMTIAGSDSSGGAGIQADLKTFTALQCYGTSVVTALTAQSTAGVDAVHPAPPEFIQQQLRSVLGDMDVAAFKTGMLYDAAAARAVAASLRAFYAARADAPPLVVDPVCVSTSGHTLLAPDAVRVLAAELFPLAALVTPNIAEAELLLADVGTGASPQPESRINSLDGALRAARKLSALGARAVLLKGGHLAVSARDMRAFAASNAGAGAVRVDWAGSAHQNMEILRPDTDLDAGDNDAPLVVDVLYERGADAYTVFARPRLASRSTHGTGCTLSAAAACFLARGHTLADAVRAAGEFTHRAIATAAPLGKGAHGPLNHLHAIVPRCVPLPTAAAPYPFTALLIRSNAPVWKAYVEHQFVRQLGAGTLPRANFLHFIKQDYQYLRYYARAYGLLVAKARRFADVARAAETIQNVLREVTLHRAYCADALGVGEAELETGTPESPATAAYGAYLLDVGLHGDETKLLVALAACLLGYGEVGRWLAAEARRGADAWVVWAGNPYLKWMEDYAGAPYQAAVRTGLDLLERAAAEDPPSPRRLAEWTETWGKCTLLEKQFWDMAMDLS
ncbi:Ribokinase-like protein [Phellopilus nigrolimitatus]|nr:Ribokinase-like protein [Phellopilus nigrolimitatus]